MKKSYISPLCEEIQVSATLELLAGSARPKYLNVSYGGGDITAD